MSGKELEEKVASSSELPTEQAIAGLRDVILGNYPNDAESIKAKEMARHPFSYLCSPALQEDEIINLMHFNS